MSTEEKLEKCLIEIDKRIYRLRFITFDSPKDELRFLYNLLSDIRVICQIEDMSLYEKYENKLSTSIYEKEDLENE